MKLLCSLLGAQGDVIARVTQLGRLLTARGHSLTFLGDFPENVLQEIAAMPAQAVKQVSDQKFDALLIGSLGGPDRLAQIAKRLPSLILVQEGFLDLMSLKGDFIHWVSLFRSARRIVFLTDLQKDKTFASFTSGLESKIMTLPSGTSPELSKLRAGVEKDYFGVVMHAPVLPHKRQIDLIAAGERLREFNLVFTFIGETHGLNALPEGTKQIIARHPARYQFVGYKTGQETHAILAQNDLYCHTSSDESWPQSVLDSASMGLPLMLSEIEAFTKVWTHGVNCLKFPTNNPDFLASSMRMLLQDDVLRQNLISQGKNTAKRFPEDRFNSAMVQMVEGLSQ